MGLNRISMGDSIDDAVDSGQLFEEGEEVIVIESKLSEILDKHLSEGSHGSLEKGLLNRLRCLWAHEYVNARFVGHFGVYACMACRHCGRIQP